jgi:hypothetical protein
MKNTFDCFKFISKVKSGTGTENVSLCQFFNEFKQDFIVVGAESSSSSMAVVQNRQKVFIRKGSENFCLVLVAGFEKL